MENVNISGIHILIENARKDGKESIYKLRQDLEKKGIIV